MPDKICRYVKNDNAEREQIEKQILKEATQGQLLFFYTIKYSKIY
jgi:hypothetical protein